MTVFHLIRHGDYSLIGTTLAGRSPGHSLSAAGCAQAEAVAAALAGRSVAVVVSSPLERALETAAPIAARAGVAVEIEPALNEIDFGDWTGLAFDRLHAIPAWRAFNSFRSATPIPGGETMLAAQARAVSVICRLRAAHPDAELALVSHGDVIKAVVAYFLAVPLDLFRRIEIGPASRSVLRVFAEDARIDALNLPPGA